MKNHGGLIRLLLTSALLAQAGCTTGTGSKRFPFEAQVGGTAANDGGPFTFNNETGWTITLDRAEVTLGPIYLNVVVPLSDTKTSLLDLLVRPAWAQGAGHLNVGRVVGEVLAQTTFSALSDQLVAFPSAGTITEEQVRTVDVWFYPEPGVSPDATKISNVALNVAGRAVRGDDQVSFRGALVLDDAWLSEQTEGTRGTQSVAAIRQVRGIPAAFVPHEGGRLEIRFDVTRPFRGANFANLSANPADVDGTKVLVQAKTGKVTTDQVMTNLYQGLRAVDTYTIDWTNP
jgi:hypothetical protein